MLRKLIGGVHCSHNVLQNHTSPELIFGCVPTSKSFNDLSLGVVIICNSAGRRNSQITMVKELIFNKLDLIFVQIVKQQNRNTLQGDDF